MTDQPQPRALHPAIAPLLLLLSLAPHLPALSAGFTFDDEEFVQRNASIRSLPAWLDSALGPFPPEDPGRALFRPVTSFSYLLDQVLLGGGAAGFHASNLAWYLLVILLAFQLFKVYLRDPRWALAAALLFSLHPVHCEAVDSITGRSELLALAFSLAALLLHIKGAGLGGAAAPAPVRRGALLLAGAGFYALAILSKETGFMLPGALLLQVLLLDGVRRSGGTPGAGEQGAAASLWPGQLLTLTPYLAVSLLYLPLRWWALGGHLRPAPHNLVSPSLWLRLHLLGKTYLEYLRLMLFPGILQVDYYYQSELARDPGPTLRSTAGLAVLGLTLAFGLSMALRGWRGREQSRGGATNPALAALGLGLFLCYLVPVSNLIPTGAVMAERFLFSPSFGFVLMVVALARAGYRGRLRQRGLAALLVAALALFAARTAYRSQDWEDEVTLWSALAAYIPDDPRITMNLGTGLARRGELDRAEAALLRVLKVQPGNQEAALNLAGVYQARGDLRGAARLLTAAIGRHPGDASLHSNLGVVLARAGRLAAARRSFTRALALNPNLASAKGHLAALARQQAQVGAWLNTARQENRPEDQAKIKAACRALELRDCM